MEGRAKPRSAIAGLRPPNRKRCLMNGPNDLMSGSIARTTLSWSRSSTENVDPAAREAASPAALFDSPGVSAWV